MGNVNQRAFQYITARVSLLYTVLTDGYLCNVVSCVYGASALVASSMQPAVFLYFGVISLFRFDEDRHISWHCTYTQ